MCHNAQNECNQAKTHLLTEACSSNDDANAARVWVTIPTDGTLAEIVGTRGMRGSIKLYMPNCIPT